MDNAVHLVQTYLRVNGYFTVVEYPVVELREGYRTATDLDVLAFRFPGVHRLIPGSAREREPEPPVFGPDPALQVPEGRADMLIAEVKEGEARFNRGGRRADVFAAALARFGCCPPTASAEVARRLLQTGAAVTPGGHGIRLVAFGSVAPEGGGRPYLCISLGHVLRFLEAWIDEHWAVLRHTQLKDPVLSFLSTLEKAREGGGHGSGSADGPPGPGPETR